MSDDENHRDIFKISLNYQGTDVLVEVPDLETALFLLNDQDAAQTFLENNYPAEIPSASGAQKQESNHGSSTSADIPRNTPHPQQYNEVIWTKKKPTEIDVEATGHLLSLRQKLSQDFDDKKQNKSKLWNKIATELTNQNFNLGDGGGERCRQKFANLTKAYLNYIKNQKTTGSEKAEVPPFFEEIHSILGSKHKVNPTILEDSIENIQPSTQPQSDTMEPDVIAPTPKEISNPAEKRFTSKKRVRPLSKSENILKVLQEDRTTRSEEFAILKAHLLTTEKQRDRLLDIMERALPKKRKRESDSEPE